MWKIFKSDLKFYYFYVFVIYKILQIEQNFLIMLSFFTDWPRKKCFISIPTFFSIYFLFIHLACHPFFLFKLKNSNRKNYLLSKCSFALSRLIYLLILLKISYSIKKNWSFFMCFMSGFIFPFWTKISSLDFRTKERMISLNWWILILKCCDF